MKSLFADDIRLLSKDGFSGEVAEMVYLRDYTSLRIGGPCSLMVSPKDPYSLKLLLEFLDQCSEDFFILGGGTNILVSDEGYEGVVINLRHWQRIETVEQSDREETLFVLAGTSLGRLINYAAERGLKGLEGLAGIPGTIGGATIGNAGSFGYEFMDVVDRVTLVTKKGMEVLTRDLIQYGYRWTSLNEPVVAVHLKLSRDEPEKIKRQIKDFLNKKKTSQPLDALSAGCVFKNPSGYSAGKLIEEAGLKGMRIGDIQISEKHANFFVNLGSGTASDFMKLYEKVKDTVERLFSVVLEPEIKMLGFK